jgi:hypothetical protein
MQQVSLPTLQDSGHDAPALALTVVWKVCRGHFVHRNV